MPGGHDSSEKKSRRRFFSCFCAKSLDEPVAFQAEPEELYPEYADAPKAFRCPITMQIMLEPVSTVRNQSVCSWEAIGVTRETLTAL